MENPIIKTGIFVLLGLFVCSFFTGCYSPDRRMIVERNLEASLLVGFEYLYSTYEHSDDPFVIDNENPRVRTYYYKDEDGVTFQASSGYYKGTFTPYKRNRCNYAEVLIEKRKDSVEAAFRPDVGKWDEHGHYLVNVSCYDDLGHVADSVEKALSDPGPLPIKRQPFEECFYYLHQSGVPSIIVRHQSGEGSEIKTGEFYFLFDGETAPAQSEILDILQLAYVKHVRDGRIMEELSEEALAKGSDPFQTISSLYVNDQELKNDLYSYRFKYNAYTGNYFIRTLDLCRDFEGAPDYNGRGNFAWLVESLGGTYECENWRAKWVIGDDKWEATLGRREKMDEDSQMTIVRNGEVLILSDPLADGWKYGRSYSLSDLELMLGVTVEVNQLRGAIYLLRV